MKKKKKIKSFFKTKKWENILKIFLSLFILYHLTMIFAVPHRRSMIHDKLMPYFTFYAHSLSFNISWDFYAPNPSSYHYFEYEIVSKKHKVETYRWPPSKKEFNRMDLNYKRLLYHSRFFMLLGSNHIQSHFLPYLCSIHPEASHITAKAFVENRPHFKKAKILKPSSLSENNKSNMRLWSVSSKACKKKIIKEI